MQSKQRGEVAIIMVVMMAGMAIWMLSGKHGGPFGMMRHDTSQVEQASVNKSAANAQESEHEHCAETSH